MTVDLTRHGLTRRERDMLDLERAWFKYDGRKVAAITQLGYTEVRYYQRLNALLDNPAAMAFDPLTVKRLRRLRDARRAQRVG